MKKLVLCLKAIAGSFASQAQDSNQDLSLDFQDGDIWYTITDENANICKMKSGSMVKEDDKFKVVYGNTVSGILSILTTASRGETNYTVTTKNANEIENLPSGIYIVNKKKILIRR